MEVTIFLTLSTAAIILIAIYLYKQGTFDKDI